MIENEGRGALVYLRLRNPEQNLLREVLEQQVVHVGEETLVQRDARQSGGNAFRDRGDVVELVPVEFPRLGGQVRQPQLEAVPILLQDQLPVFRDEEAVDQVAFGPLDEMEEVRQRLRLHPDRAQGGGLPSVPDLGRLADPSIRTGGGLAGGEKQESESQCQASGEAEHGGS